MGVPIRLRHDGLAKLTIWPGPLHLRVVPSRLNALSSHWTSAIEETTSCVMQDASAESCRKLPRCAKTLHLRYRRELFEISGFLGADQGISDHRISIGMGQAWEG